MPSNSETKVGNEEKLLLTNYLLAQVVEGLSGRDGEDIVEKSPLRTIFSGVLQYPRNKELDAARKGHINMDAQHGTSIGLEFRVKLADKANEFRLRISPRWSLYYAVFPTYEQAYNANKHLLFEKSQDINEVIIEDDELEDLDEEEPQVNSNETTLGQVDVSPVFRRKDVVPASIDVSLKKGEHENIVVGSDILDNELTSAKQTISEDPDIWRHLGVPEKCIRSIGDRTVLDNPESYALAISKSAGKAVDLPPWSILLQVETMFEPSEPDIIRVRVILANSTPEPDKDVNDRKLEERNIFDARLKVEIEGGSIEPFEFLLAPKDYKVNPLMPAKGINCTAKFDPKLPDTIHSESLPIFRQPLYRTKDNLEITFDSLIGTGMNPSLEVIAKAMEDYLSTWDEYLDLIAPQKLTESELKACRLDRNCFAAEVNRFKLGQECLRKMPVLAEAFSIMNRCFQELSKASQGKVKAWRLFQIGFIVSQMPSLAIRQQSPGSNNDEFSHNLHEAFNEVGILWFPTGGGKTEAYLGLIATTLIFDRLRGKSRGVSAWMRFPLRMLSLQQLARLAKVIGILNIIRASDERLKDGDPFAIGYFVGEGVTPNSLSKDNAKGYAFRKDLREKAMLLRQCPFCGSKDVNIQFLSESWRLAHVCQNKDCFSNTDKSMGIYKGSLPLCIVDTEIFRYLPSVLIGTVDKLAIVGRNKYFHHITRGVTQKCKDHGYTSYNECIEKYTADCKSKNTKLESLKKIKDPGPALLIQDELHLLRAELGVFNGHYEGLLRYLGNKSFMAPKVLAATATIEAYDVHAFHVYLSRANRFPQPSWDSDETFYATSKPFQERRYFVGVLGHTRAIEEVTLRILVLYWRALRRLKNNLDIVRQVINRQDLDDVIINDILRLYDLSLCYVNEKATGGRMNDKLSQANRTLETENLGILNSTILTGDQTAEHIGGTLERLEIEREDTGSQRLDVVIATNMISHGVDLERINMMTLSGMPSHYAEYVQASSRSARSHPGIIFSCFRAKDARESSQYEFFQEMHTHMDRLIEAVAVNRYASFAPQKTVPGILSALLLCEHSPRLFESKQIAKPLDDLPTVQVALGLRASTTKGTIMGCIDGDYLQNSVKEIIGVDKHYPPASPAQISNVRLKVEGFYEELRGVIGRSIETKLKEALNPITSFRDVDEGVNFGSKDSASASLVARISSK